MLQNAIRNLKNQEGEGEGGFTLIELLVVILIIGILAAIALPTFLGQSDKAKDSAAKSDVRNAVTQIESCIADGTVIASCTNAATNPELGQFKLVTAVAASGDKGYTITATSKAGTGHWYTIAKSSANPGGYTYTAGPDATGKDAWAANGAS